MVVMCDTMDHLNDLLLHLNRMLSNFLITKKRHEQRFPVCYKGSLWKCQNNCEEKTVAKGMYYILNKHLCYLRDQY